ncbi:MAG TPA: hypothetical protein VGB09_03000 [Candidatus Binatia bacterium]
MSKVPPPRAAFVDHPVGRTFGPPNERSRHESVLTRALAELPNFASRCEIRDLGCHWLADGSREWEAELRADMLHDR